MKSLCTFYLLLTCLSCQTIRSVDVDKELNRVKEGKQEPADLPFNYYHLVDLDTSYYSIISQFEDFDHEIIEKDLFPQMANSPHNDTLSLSQEYESVIEVVNKSKKFNAFINPEKLKVMEPVAVSGEKALIKIDNTTYLLELINSYTIGITYVASVFYDGIPQSWLRKWERMQKREARKKKKKGSS